MPLDQLVRGRGRTGLVRRVTTVGRLRNNAARQRRRSGGGVARGRHIDIGGSIGPRTPAPSTYISRPPPLPPLRRRHRRRHHKKKQHDRARPDPSLPPTAINIKHMLLIFIPTPPTITWQHIRETRPEKVHRQHQPARKRYPPSPPTTQASNRHERFAISHTLQATGAQ